MIDQHLFKEKKAAYHTLGCKLNFSETSTIARTMGEHGFIKVDFDEFADIYVINTCSVTEVAEKKCRTAIQKAIRQNPQAFIVVTGCFAQLKPENLAQIQGVDLILGSNEKFDIALYLGHLEKHATAEIHTGAITSNKEFKPSYSFGDRTRCFLKVQDGCDYYCSYCTIPLARGHSRNSTISQTVELAQKAVADGAREIILTGVNIGDFGRSTGENFFDLIRQLDDIDGVERFRISSIEPNLITDEMIEWVAQSKHFMPHFHIPLQSGSDNVLKLMKRRYDTALFAHRIETIRKYIPHAFIGVDVIVGVRGESNYDFEITHQFLHNLDVSQLHVFTYSERPNTQALKITENVPHDVRKQRNQVLHLLSEKKLTDFYSRFIGTESTVLVESHNDDGVMYGFTSNYIKCEMPFNADLANTIQPVHLDGFNRDRTAIKATLIK
jgi:threonylcarbamoyladenosine tRNA methylthiotransferase MtaB